MKMKTNFKKILLIALFSAMAVMSCLTFASCGKTTEKKYDYKVTFDYNVGNIEANCENQFLGVMKDSLVGLKPGERTDFAEQVVQGYYLEGWYTAKTDENGEPIKDEVTGRVVLGEKWDFDTMTVSGDLTLYANLLRVAEVSFVDVDVYPTEPNAEGAVLDVKKQTPDTVIQRPEGRRAPQKDGYTLLEYYKDAECTEVFEFPYKVTTENVVVYTKFIAGSWKIIKTEEELMKALASPTASIYLANDLDFEGEEWIYGDYNGEFNGNGHTIRNISLKRVCSKNAVGSGIFGALGEKTYIHDVTFEDVKLEFKVAIASGEFKSGFMAYSAKEGAKLKNVKVSGTLFYDYGDNVMSSVSKWIANDGSVSENCDYTEVVEQEAKIKA